MLQSVSSGLPKGRASGRMVGDGKVVVVAVILKNGGGVDKIRLIILVSIGVTFLYRKAASLTLDPKYHCESFCFDKQTKCLVLTSV